MVRVGRRETLSETLGREKSCEARLEASTTTGSSQQPSMNKRGCGRYSRFARMRCLLNGGGRCPGRATARVGAAAASEEKKEDGVEGDRAAADAAAEADGTSEPPCASPAAAAARRREAARPSIPDGVLGRRNMEDVR
jgi:hypothetical protein